LIVEVAQEADRRIGRADRVATLVDPPVDTQSDAAPGARHDLPDADRSRAGVGVWIEPAFDQRQVDHVFREPGRVELGAHHRLVLRAALEPALEPVAGGSAEHPHIMGDALLRLVGSDVEVPRRLLGRA
jgi:hypothetical protein